MSAIPSAQVKCATSAGLSMAEQWRALATPPLTYQQVALLLPDDQEIIGWRVDSGGGNSVYLTWSREAAKPSKYTSAYQNAGVLAVQPRAWRPFVRERMQVDLDMIPLRECAVVVQRAILTDGTLRPVKQEEFRSSWAHDLHIPSTNVGDYAGMDFETPPPRFRPEPFDISNYLWGMGWFARLGKPGQVVITRTQQAIVFKAYGLSNEQVGDRFRVSRQRAARIYWDGIERAWGFARSETDYERRLPRAYWDKQAAPV